MSKKIVIYTDGSCLVNPGGAGGWAAIIFENHKDPHPIKISGYSPETTNQRMELMAAIQPLRLYANTSRDIVIFSDSSYLVNCMNDKWYVRWLANGWKNAKGEPVANVDLWEILIKLLDTHNISFYHVKGHATNLFNNECDKMAREITSFWKSVPDENKKINIEE